MNIKNFENFIKPEKISTSNDLKYLEYVVEYIVNPPIISGTTMWNGTWNSENNNWNDGTWKPENNNQENKFGDWTNPDNNQENKFGDW